MNPTPHAPVAVHTRRPRSDSPDDRPQSPVCGCGQDLDAAAGQHIRTRGAVILTAAALALTASTLAAGLTAARAAGSPAHDEPARTLTGDACDHPDPAVTAPAPASLKVGTYNIRAGVPVTTFTAGVHAFVPHTDIAGLQEVSSMDKAQALADLAGSGWSFWRQSRTDIPSDPHQGGTRQQPVLWRTDRFTCTYAGPALLSPSYSTAGELPYFNGDKNHWFTVVHLTDKVTGQHIAVLDVHLIHGAVKDGEPVPGLPRHWHTYVTQMTNLVAEAQRQQDGGTVFVLGDFNAGYLEDLRKHHAHLPIRAFKAIGFTSMWATQTPKNGLGTRKDFLIDQVYAVQKAASAHVLFSVKGYSDHLPAVATYYLPAGPPRA